MSTEPPTEQLGLEGEGCRACGAPLATDQRYCLNCGHARTGPRLDFSKHLVPAMGAAPAAASPGVGAPAAKGQGGAAPAGMAQVSPVVAVFSIALLGVMLLLGVLIGKDDDGSQTVAAAPATATTPVAAAPTESAAAAPSKDKSKGKGGGGAAPGQGKIEAGGSGDTTGVAVADTNKSPAEALRGPDVVATQGEEAELDPGGPVGGGSDAVCIGC